MEPTKQNVAAVMNGFAKFFEYMVQTKSVDLKNFTALMEPIFKAQGYRDVDRRIRGGNILILTEIAAGDFITASGAIREIRRLYPDARITLLVNPRTRELAECCPYVDEVILNSQKVTSYTPLFELYQMHMTMARKLLEQRFDICFAFAIHPHMPLLMYMSGARVRVTATDHENMEEFNRSRSFTDYLMHLATNINIGNAYGYHMADRFFSVVENFLHLPITNRKLEAWYTPADVGVAKDYLQGISAPIYSLNMGSVYPKNHYPPEKYAQLLEMILRKEPTAHFVILGNGQQDLNSAEKIKTVAPKIYAEKIIDLTNKLSYMQSAAVLSFCDLHIGNDTGTMHVAAAVGCPVLTLMCFAADLPLTNKDNPKIWYPYGVPNIVVLPKHILPECKNIKFHDMRGCAANFPHCITQIKPETLFKAFNLLKKRIADNNTEPLYMH